MPDDRRSRPASNRGGGRGGSARSGRGGRKSGGRRGDDRRPERPEPRTEAERRAADVRATRGPRRTPRTEESEREKIESRTTEQWIDEGSLRSEAESATRRALGGSRSRRSTEIDPSVVAEIHDAADSARAGRLSERLASASAALDRERYDDARRMATSLVKELPKVAAVHEVIGLASYRTGRWRQAAQSLELARRLHPDPSLLPVLADCYRAMRRWTDVDSVWREVKKLSPKHEVMAEARIVAASALADRGELREAVALMEQASKAPKRVREHHLRQWYVLADLYDRAGDPVSASRWFREIAAHDAGYADVRERLRSLGR